METTSQPEMAGNQPAQDLEAGALHIISALRARGHLGLWAGGAVRDRLLGCPFSDIDIATSASPEEVVALFPQAVLVGQSFGVVRLPLPEGTYEIATFRKDGVYLDGRHPERVAYTDDPAVDAQRRDFTVNALFYDPLEDKVLDFVRGRCDLDSHLIRAVGDPSQRFAEDRLRLLRAVRFAAQLDFAIEPETWRALQAQALHIAEISAERIRDEILRILIQPRASRAFRLLRDSGLLAVILPEVERMTGVQQPEEFHPEGDVFDHTMLLLDHLEDPAPEVALAALLHDIGKPDSFVQADRIRFNGHDKLGAEMFDRIADRFRLPNRLREAVRELIAQHMRIGQARKMKPSTLKRMLRSANFSGLLELHRLDCLASHRDLELHLFCREHLDHLSEEQLKPKPFLSGNDLIELGLLPGPLFKAILSEVEDLQLEGKVASREEALQFVEGKYL
jgi:poly(A) polymerase